MLPLLAQQEPSNFQKLFDQLARTPLSQVLTFVTVCTVLRLAAFPYLTKTPPHRRTGNYGTVRFFNELLDAVIYAGVVVFMLIRPFGVQTFLIPSGSMLDTLQINDFIIANKAVYRSSEPKRGDIIVFKPPRYALDANQTDVDFIKRLIGVPGDVIEVRDGSLYRNGKRITEPYLKDPYINSDWKLVHYTGPYARWKDLYIPVTYQKADLNSSANYETYVSRQWAIGFRDENTGEPERSVPSSWKAREDFTPEEAKAMQYLVDAPPAAIPPGHFLMMGDNRNNSYDGRGWGLITRDAIVGRSEIVWWPPPRWRRTLPVRTN